MRNNSHFRRGRSTFPCNVCKRVTRDTGQGIGTELCFECYEIAGLDNMVNDNGYEPGTPDYQGAFRECEALLAKAVKLGGDGQRIKDCNDYIWPNG